MTRVAVLTPAGTGAIATVALSGSGAWTSVRTLFRPVGKPLPVAPAVGEVWFGKLGERTADEVVVSVTQSDPEPCIEVHCHGGRQVVKWIVELIKTDGGVDEVDPWTLASPKSSDPLNYDPRALEALSRAATLRTASILLDQLHGAFTRTATDALHDPTALAALATCLPVGRHLTAPWRVAVVGPPNVGKSSLINVLAGYQRSSVSPVAGTTRDVVTTSLAIDGWPITLADTAGLNETADVLESAGIELARSAIDSADVVVWVVDLSSPNPIFPNFGGALVVANKADLPVAWDASLVGDDPVVVSAATGEGIPALVNAISRRLVPTPPPLGSGIPYTPALCDAVELAYRQFQSGGLATARQSLLECLPRT